VVGVPDVKANYNGWNSIITIRYNDYLSPNAVVRVTFYDTNGNELVTITNTVGAYGIWILDASTAVGSNFSGSAMVAANRDVSVVVQNRHSHMITAYDGISAVTGLTPDPGFACAANTLRLPLVMRDYFLYGHRWNSTIHIQNTGIAPATDVKVYVYPEGGGESVYTDVSDTIQPGASIQLDASDWPLGTFRGTAKIESDQPVAAVVNEVNTDSDRAMAYNAFSSGARDVYLPLSFRDWWELYSEIPVQNIDSSDSSVTVTYYEQGTSWSCDDSEDIGSNALYIFYPPSEPPCDMDGRLAAAVVRNSSSDLIALLDERRDEQPRRSQYMTYNGVAKTDSMETSYVSHVPILYRNYGGWQSSIQAQNIHTDTIFITADFFDQSGDEILFLADWVPANRSTTFYLPAVTDLGYNYVGSSVVAGHDQVDYPGGHVNRKLIAIANVQNFNWEWQGGGNLDWGGGYNGFNR
jgi:hypothetical protein